MTPETAILTEEIVRPAEGSGLAFLTGFFFSARMIIVLASVHLLGADPRTGAEISLTLNLLLLAAACFHAFGPGERTFASILRQSSVRWVLGFLALSLCSLAWSATVSLATSTVYWSGMAADVAIVLLLLRTGSIAEGTHSLMKGFIVSTCCLALIAWVMPAQSDLRLGDEDFFNTNQIGNLCAFAIFLAQYLMRVKSGRWGLAAGFLAITLIRSLSKTTIVAFLLCECFLLIQDRSISQRTKLLLASAAMLIVLAFWGLFEAYYDVYTTAGGQNQAETLTGRTAIWAYVSVEAVDKPWIGHGFDSMWKVIPPFSNGTFEARHAENEILQQFYAYGIAGIVMLAGLYGSLYRKVRSLPRGPVRAIFACLISFAVIRGLAEAEPFDLLLPLWFIVLISTLVDPERVSAKAASTDAIAATLSGEPLPSSA